MLDEQPQQLLPFTIEPYSKEDRLKDRECKPKLGLRRLTQDKKIVSIDIDIPLDENTIIKDKFDWDLSKDKLSPSDFCKQLAQSLQLPSEYAEKMKEQILSQIMAHIKAHTKQKPAEERQSLDDAIYRSYQPIRFNNQYPEQDLQKEQNQKKKMSRMRRNDMKRTTVVNTAQPNRYFKQKKICKNCKNENITPGYQCKHCKMPFELLQLLNLEDRRVKISVKYYQKIANKIPLLTYEAKKRHFQKEDFDSFYAIYNKIRSIFYNSDELSKENLNQVKYIMQKYHEFFLNGQIDFNDDEIIYQKDMRKDPKDEDQRPKRQRGRPRKIKIINDDIIPNSENNDSSLSQQQHSEPEEDSDDSS